MNIKNSILDDIIQKQLNRSQKTEVTSTSSIPVENVVIASKGLQDRNNLLLDGRTVENKGKLILTEIFPTVQKRDI